MNGIRKLWFKGLIEVFSTSLMIILLGEVLYRGWGATFQWVAAHPSALIVSAAFVLLCQMAFELVLARWVALSLLAAMFSSFSLADRVKFLKLGVPALPTDLLLSRQYGKLAFMIWGYRWLGVALGICALAIALAWWARRLAIPMIAVRSRRLYGQLLRFACLGAVIFLVVQPDYNYKNARFRQSAVASQFDDWGIFNMNWAPDTNVMINGQLLAFVLNAKSALLLQPAGYSQSLIEKALSGPSTGVEPTVIGKSKPDIIVIMSEALWDPSVLPGVRYSDRLLERLNYTQRGTLFSPVFGGYTANTEFEFLTRLSNANLPIGSIPYMQYIQRPINSLAADLKANGYSTTAVHPFDGRFWNRREVYPKLGFDCFVEGDDFAFKDRAPPYISDVSMSREILSLIEEGGKPHFIFAVSIQNHGPYLDGKTRYENEPRVEVFDDTHRLTPAAIDILSSYASGVRDAARGFEKVTEFYRRTNRPAVVMMFGDHLPFLGDNFLVYAQADYVHSVNPTSWTPVEQERMHGVPIFVWSNVSEHQVFPKTSLSPIYLGSFLKRVAYIPETKMDLLLDRMRAVYPVISQFYTREGNGKVLDSPPLKDGVAKDYAAVSYDELFGRNYSEQWIEKEAPPRSEKRTELVRPSLLTH